MHKVKFVKSDYLCSPSTLSHQRIASGGIRSRLKSEDIGLLDSEWQPSPILTISSLFLES
jgi:hypothetical protein